MNALSTSLTAAGKVARDAAPETAMPPIPATILLLVLSNVFMPERLFRGHPVVTAKR